MQPIIRPLSQEFLYASPESLDRACYQALATACQRRRVNRSSQPTRRGHHAPRQTR